MAKKKTKLISDKLNQKILSYEEQLKNYQNKDSILERENNGLIKEKNMLDQIYTKIINIRGDILNFQIFGPIFVILSSFSYFISIHLTVNVLYGILLTFLPSTIISGLSVKLIDLVKTRKINKILKESKLNLSEKEIEDEINTLNKYINKNHEFHIDLTDKISEINIILNSLYDFQDNLFDDDMDNDSQIEEVLAAIEGNEKEEIIKLNLHKSDV